MITKEDYEILKRYIETEQYLEKDNDCPFDDRVYCYDNCPLANHFNNHATICNRNETIEKFVELVNTAIEDYELNHKIVQSI